MYQIERIKITAESKISELVLSNPYSMLMLEHFGIELPLQERIIKDECEDRNINISLFLALANLYNGYPNSFTESFSHNDINTIINYLKNSHLYYSDEIYPKLTGIIRQLNKKGNNKELEMVEKFFNEYFDEVIEHLKYENEIVFPYILSLFKSVSDENGMFNPKHYSVGEYKEHHNDIEEKLDDLVNLLIKYLPATIDQQMRRELLFSLFLLDHDLKIHSQIEDFILIPLVSQMEKKLNK